MRRVDSYYSVKAQFNCTQFTGETRCTCSFEKNRFDLYIAYLRNLKLESKIYKKIFFSTKKYSHFFFFPQNLVVVSHGNLNVTFN